jgi:hypothetical protein
MNQNKKRKASGQVPVAALLAPQHSIVLIDPKSELAALTAHKTKRSRRGVLTVNPFLVLPPDHLEACGKWFRLCVKTAIADLIKGQRKEGNERQRG